MKRSYLHRLMILILLGIMIPIVVFLIFFWLRSLQELEHANETYYETLVDSYVSIHEEKLRELNRFTGTLHVQSKDSTSIFFQGEDSLTNSHYQMYLAVKELHDVYTLDGIVRWGIYFYDSGKVVTSGEAMHLDAFVRSKYQKATDRSDLQQFFSKDNYLQNKICFGITSKDEESNKRSLLVGICTVIGKYNDEALVFFEINADDYFNSLVVRREPGYAFYLMDEDTDTILISSGERLTAEEELLLFAEEAELISRGNTRILYKNRSDFSGFSIAMYITGDSLQNSIMKFSHDMRYIMTGVIIGLILISFCIVYITYKPIHNLMKGIDDNEGDEIEVIQRTLDNRSKKITEQEMMVMDLLLNHLLYGVHVSAKKLNLLGVDPAMKYYSVFLLSDYVVLSGEAQKLTEEVEKRFPSRFYVTDWQEGKDSIFILFADRENRKEEVEQVLKKWMQDSFIKKYILYAGTVVSQLDDIQISLRSCLDQRGTENGGEGLENSKEKNSERKQNEKKDEILAYLELNFRDANLSQTEVADVFGISNYTLSRLFKNRVGVGFSEYLSAKRIECASTLLLTTDYSVSEVAVMSGFSSINYFSKTFKAYMGVSPSNYRNQ